MEAWKQEMYSDTLCHFGIMGMKWGVRRYQNPDGSLTAAGRSRYGNGGRSFNPYDRKINKYRRAQAAAERDAKDLKSHGYDYESIAVSNVARKNKEKAEKIETLKKSYNGKMTDTQRVALIVAGIAGAKSIKDSIKNLRAANEMVKDITQGMGHVPIKEAIGKTALAAGKVAVISALATIGTVKITKAVAKRVTESDTAKQRKLQREKEERQRESSRPKGFNIVSSSSYNKAFLDYIKPDVVKPEMVDDPELMELLIMEYESATGKKAIK